METRKNLGESNSTFGILLPARGKPRCAACAKEKGGEEAGSLLITDRAVPWHSGAVALCAFPAQTQRNGLADPAGPADPARPREFGSGLVSVQK